jgi:LuxR family maltose regulon positive regulatory protein
MPAPVSASANAKCCPSLAFGHSNKQIARRLNLSENTVKFHLKNLYRKLDANSRAEALSRAQLLGLLHSRVAEGPAGAG